MARIPEEAWKELDKLFAENPAPDRREIKVILVGGARIEP